jgi:hypothetical protein
MEHRYARRIETDLRVTVTLGASNRIAARITNFSLCGLFLMGRDLREPDNRCIRIEIVNGVETAAHQFDGFVVRAEPTGVAVMLGYSIAKARKIYLDLLDKHAQPKLFRPCLEIHPHDAYAATYLARKQALIASPLSSQRFELSRSRH